MGCSGALGISLRVQSRHCCTACVHAPVVCAGLCMAEYPRTQRVVGGCLTGAGVRAAAGVDTSQAASFQGSPLELSYWVSHNLPLQVRCRCCPTWCCPACPARVCPAAPTMRHSHSSVLWQHKPRGSLVAKHPQWCACVCVCVHAAALHAPAAADVLLPCRPAEAAAGAAAASRQAVLQRLWHAAGHHSRCAGDDNRGHWGHIRQQPRVSRAGNSWPASVLAAWSLPCTPVCDCSSSLLCSAWLW